MATENAPLAAALLLFFCLSLSRVGLWTFDLAETSLVQYYVPANIRGEYSGVEAMWINLFEFAHWTLTAVWSSQYAFVQIGTAGGAVVCLSLFAYAVWMRMERGHLIHTEKVCCGYGSGAQSRVEEEDEDYE